MANKNNLTKKQVKRKRRRLRHRIFFALEIVVLLVLVAGLFVYAKLGNMNFDELDVEQIGVNSTVEENEVMQGYTTIALVGLDIRSDDGSSLKQSNSDTMIIASINNDTKKVKLVSVYRDTYLRIGEDEEGNGIYNKANSAYARGGREQFLNMLNTNLDLNVTDCISVDFSAVATTAELLGGIDVELKAEECVHLNNYVTSMEEDVGMTADPLPEIDGTYHLNGIQTVAYARIRYTAGNDFRRAARQREVIYKLVEKAKNSDLATLNSIMDEVFPMVYSSISKAELITMGMNFLYYDIEDQTGFPFDHLYGETVTEALDLDCVVPVTLESNVIKLHEFLYPEDDYTPSEEVVAYSNRIIEKSGFDLSSQLAQSEDGSLAAYHSTDDTTESTDTTE